MYRLALILALLLTILSPSTEASEASPAEAAPAQADSFEREVLKVLRGSHAAKRSVVVHVGGETVTGIVIAIGPDAVVLSNREHGRIVVRRERIDAVEGD